MTPQQLIESGLLEAYVLGQCTASERADVENMAAQHPEVRAELQAVEQTIERYAAANAVAPPAWMKGRILDLIAREPGVSIPPSAPAYGWLKIAAIPLLLAALLLGFLLRQSKKEQSVQKAQIAELQRQAEDCTRREARSKLLDQEIALLRDRDTRPVQIGDGKDSRTYVYHNTLRSAAYLDVAAMPAPPPGKYYQAWALLPDVNGVKQHPVSLGMVDLASPGGLQQLRYQAGAAGYAISIEDHPEESKTPTVVAMVGRIS